MQPCERSSVQQDAYRVTVMDDSAVIRGLVTRWLSGEPGIEVVGSATNGAMALRQVERLDPDVVLLDIEMPEMDGLTALPKLLELVPDLKVIMSSTLTAKGAEVSLRALSLGASDYIPKPVSTREGTAAQSFRDDLVSKVRALAASRRERPIVRRNPVDRGAAVVPIQSQPLKPAPTRIVLRPASRLPAKVLAIGSSTGGPQALFQVFSALKGRIKLPILITQHMPPTFTTILAEHLARISGVECREAVQGELVVPGRIYVAPGDWHMTVEEEAGVKRIRLNQDPPENFCRPAVDPMLRSLIRVYGGQVLTLILTGMGADGLKGARAVVEAGGTVVAQDEASSIVWGMPGAVSTARLCSAVLPIGEIGQTIERMTMGAAA